jgi:hypothetical protein
MYSGVQILRARERLAGSSPADKTPAAQLFDKLLTVDADQWDVEIRNGTAKDVKAAALIGEIQKTMETVVLGLENGSMAQRVQAEFLRELVSRAESARPSES